MTIDSLNGAQSLAVLFYLQKIFENCFPRLCRQKHGSLRFHSYVTEQAKNHCSSVMESRIILTVLNKTYSLKNELSWRHRYRIVLKISQVILYFLMLHDQRFTIPTQALKKNTIFFNPKRSYVKSNVLLQNWIYWLCNLAASLLLQSLLTFHFLITSKAFPNTIYSVLATAFL